MAKKLAWFFGIVFVIVGILGWVSNPIVGMGAIFETNHVHDFVHLLFGVILILVAYSSPAKSAVALKVIGIVYLLVAILGFFMVPQGGALLGLVHTNMADHWLHIVLGVVLLGAGLMNKDRGMMQSM